jgi:prohibitin 2
MPFINAYTMVFIVLITVDVGHYAIKFNKLTGLSPQVYKEGYNFKIPVIEEPIIYNVQTR